MRRETEYLKYVYPGVWTEGSKDKLINDKIKWSDKDQGVTHCLQGLFSTNECLDRNHNSIEIISNRPTLFFGKENENQFGPSFYQNMLTLKQEYLLRIENSEDDDKNVCFFFSNNSSEICFISPIVLSTMDSTTDIVYVDLNINNDRTGINSKESSSNQSSFHWIFISLEFFICLFKVLGINLRLSWSH